MNVSPIEIISEDDSQSIPISKDDRPAGTRHPPQMFHFLSENPQNSYSIPGAGGGNCSGSDGGNGPGMGASGGYPQGKKSRGKQKINIEFMREKNRRYSTFSKRKTGLMKKAFELAQLTGAEVLLLVASETSHVYTFATEKLKAVVDSEGGKALIQTCLCSNRGGGGANSGGGAGFQFGEEEEDDEDDDAAAGSPSIEEDECDEGEEGDDNSFQNLGLQSSSAVLCFDDNIPVVNTVTSVRNGSSVAPQYQQFSHDGGGQFASSVVHLKRPHTQIEDAALGGGVSYPLPHKIPAPTVTSVSSTLRSTSSPLILQQQPAQPQQILIDANVLAQIQHIINSSTSASLPLSSSVSPSAQQSRQGGPSPLSNNNSNPHS